MYCICVGQPKWLVILLPKPLTYFRNVQNSRNIFSLSGTQLRHIQIKIKNPIYLVLTTKESNFPISHTIIRSSESSILSTPSRTPKWSHPLFNTSTFIYDYGTRSWEIGFFANHGKVDGDFIFLDVAELSAE